MMDKNAIPLLVAVVLTSISLLFTIISVSTPGWAGNGNLALFKCPALSDCSQLTGAGVLLIIAIIFLSIVTVLLVLIARGSISTTTGSVKSLLILFIVLAAIFIIAGYARALIPISSYSYHLAVTAGIFTFISGMIVSYLAGQS